MTLTRAAAAAVMAVLIAVGAGCGGASDSGSAQTGALKQRFERAGFLVVGTARAESGAASRGEVGSLTFHQGRLLVIVDQYRSAREASRARQALTNLSIPRGVTLEGLGVAGNYVVSAVSGRRGGSAPSFARVLDLAAPPR